MNRIMRWIAVAVVLVVVAFFLLWMYSWNISLVEHEGEITFEPVPTSTFEDP